MQSQLYHLATPYPVQLFPAAQICPTAISGQKAGTRRHPSLKHTIPMPERYIRTAYMHKTDKYHPS